MEAIDPRFYVGHEEVKPFIHDVRVDLTAADAPIVAAGRFVVCTLTVPKGQVQIIKSIAPYAMKRTNVGVVGVESFQMLTPEEANGYFNFEPFVQGNSPWIITADVNTPRLMAAPLNNDRQSANGIMYVSRDPYQDVARSWFNPMYNILVPSDRKFTVVFSLVPAATASPIANTFVIGNPVAPATKRVDFAGAVLGGMTMAESHYRNLTAKIKQSEGI